MTQERIEAAAKALATKDRTNLSSWHQEEATAALAAADAVMFSDEAIERAAEAIHDLGCASGREWESREEAVRELYREDVRTVVASLKGDA